MVVVGPNNLSGVGAQGACVSQAWLRGVPGRTPGDVSEFYPPERAIKPGSACYTARGPHTTQYLSRVDCSTELGPYPRPHPDRIPDISPDLAASVTSDHIPPYPPSPTIL